MAGRADMTAAAFVTRYGCRPQSRRRSSVFRRPLETGDRRLMTTLVRLEVDGIAVTIPEFLAAHARCCDCLTERGHPGCSKKR